MGPGVDRTTSPADVPAAAAAGTGLSLRRLDAYAEDCAAVRARLADLGAGGVVIPDTTVTFLDGMSAYGD
jgi:hypothetical protein